MHLIGPSTGHYGAIFSTATSAGAFKESLDLTGITASKDPGVTLTLAAGTRKNLSKGRIVPMKTMMAAILLCMAAAITMSAQTTTTFEIAGSGSAGAEGTIVYGINSAGTVVGTYFDTADVAQAYMRTKGGVDTVITPPNSVEAEAAGINTAGVITGTYADSNGVGQGFVRAADGTFTEFSAPGAGNAKGQGTVPRAINASGTVAGVYKDSRGVSHAFVRSAKGKITQFSPAGAGTNAGQGTFMTILFFGNGPIINKAGDVVGYYVDASDVYHAFLRAANGTITDFEAPGAGTGTDEGTIAAGINSKGTIVGSYRDANKAWHGFTLATDGTFTDINAGLGTTSLNGTFAYGINDSGVVTGSYGDTDINAAEGFVRAADGTITDFTAPDAGDKGNGQGTWPVVVNNAGDVAGLVLDDNQVFHGFLRTP
jgi:hypothetical protein